jgi:group I intron endonuclease
METVNIYKITNITNGLIYIGQTVQHTERRWSRHIYDALVKNKPQPFYDAIRQFGKESFRFEKIAEANDKEWGDYLETLYILIYDSTNPNIGYNRMLGGRAGRHTPANKAKISAKSREWWEDPENKKRASESRRGLLIGEKNPMFGRHDLGRPHTEETKQHLSKIRVEAFKDPEFKKRMSEANRGKHHTSEGKANISKGSTGNHKQGTTQTEETKARISASLKKAFAEGRRKKTGGIKKGTILGPMSDEEKQKRSDGVKKARQENNWSTRRKEADTQTKDPA